MGRSKKWKRDRERKERDSQPTSSGKPITKGYIGIVKENKSFEKYYKLQGIIPENEWDDFMSSVRENLPATFRITGYKKQAKALLKIIQGQYFKNLMNVAIEGEVVHQPKCLPWYPDNLAWQLTLSRISIRRSEEFAKLHNFLVSETASGNISRQETVSMIPPLLLDVQPHHKVLDMCAAPGSKTSQVIEMLHKHEGKIPEGVVVANDIDNKRCYMLVHQAKRLNSPCFIVTNNDASNLPNFRMPKGDGYEQMKFDRILCDVPCSGDGTIRKNIDVWNKWNAANGNNLHGVQVRIASRGLELLAKGGKLVYSTCSMNPIEDEAVITTLLQKSKGCIELLDVSESLPGLKTMKGVSHWKVLNRHLELFDKFEDVPESFSTQIRPQMFPPSPEEAQELHLDRCLRILPHHQDTGGFFVAVLQKSTDTLPWESKHPSTENNPPKNDLLDGQNDAQLSAETGTVIRNGSDNGRNSPPRKKQKFTGYKEDPYFFLDQSDEALNEIRSFYNIDPSFPTSQILTRCRQGKKRNLYLVSKEAKLVVQGNNERLKIINTGVRIFGRCDNKDARCGYRLCQEGLLNLLPFLSNRKITVPRDDLILLLSDEYPDQEKFSEFVLRQVRDSGSGSVVISYLANQGLENELEILLCGWQGKASLRCYVPKIDRIHYLRLAGVDVTELETREKKFRQARDMKVEPDNKSSVLAEADLPETNKVSSESNDHTSVGKDNFPGNERNAVT